VHLARAVALAPALLILEHPGADLEADVRRAFADCVASVTDAGVFATLVITKDDDFAKRAAHRALRLEPATGALKPIKRGWFR
jgi:ABC-type sulfate/molybdate transport systems ATPase subunit